MKKEYAALMVLGAILLATGLFVTDFLLSAGSSEPAEVSSEVVYETDAAIQGRIWELEEQNAALEAQDEADQYRVEAAEANADEAMAALEARNALPEATRVPVTVFEIVDEEPEVKQDLRPGDSGYDPYVDGQ